MLGISSVGVGRAYDPSYLSARSHRLSGPGGTQAVERVSPAQTTPVPPVSRTAPVQRDTAQPVIQGGPQLPLLREGADPVEMAVRGRIQYLSQEGLPAVQEGSQAKSPQEIMEEGECQTCKERKYQDGSNDPGVSYQTPTNIDPTQAASAVRGHEQEHVVREQAKAKREGREVVSQSVTLHTDICPECGKVYISGGTTRTTTREAQVAQLYQQQEEQPSLFQAVA